MSSLQINPNLSHCKPCNTFEVTLQLNHKWSYCYEVTCCSCHAMWLICTRHTRRFTIHNTYVLEQHFESNLHCKSVCESLSDTITNSVVDFCGGNDSNDFSDSYFENEMECSGIGVFGIVERLFAIKINSHNQATVL